MQGIYYQTQYFKLTIYKNEPHIKCVCGKAFRFYKYQHEKVEIYAHCPQCNELWHYEELKDKYLLIRPSTNAQIHLYKDGKYMIGN